MSTVPPSASASRNDLDCCYGGEPKESCVLRCVHFKPKLWPLVQAARATPSHEREPKDGTPLLYNVHCMWQQTTINKADADEWEAQWRELLAAIDQHLVRVGYPNAAAPANEQQRNEILSAPTSPQGPLELTPAEVGIHDPAPEREGEIAARESLEPEGAGQCHRQRTASLADAQNGLTGRRDAHPSSIAARGAVIPFDLLDEIEDYFEQRQDVRDGADGPRPNLEMHLFQRLRDEAYSAKPSAIGERK